jgi:hypothetical protein
MHHRIACMIYHDYVLFSPLPDAGLFGDTMRYPPVSKFADPVNGMYVGIVVLYHVT